MNQQAFEAHYGARWNEFSEWLKRRSGPRGKPSAEPLLDPMEVPARYRELCQHLALARDRQYSADLIERLSRLALSGHQMLYGARARGPERVWQFVRAGFPRAVRREIVFVWAAVLLFFGPLLLLTFAIPQYPEFAYVVLPADTLDGVQKMYGDGLKTLGRQREADTDVQMFGFYIFNNVRIGFQTFASGIVFGLGHHLLSALQRIVHRHHHRVHRAFGTRDEFLLVHVRTRRVRADGHLPVGRRRTQDRLCAGRSRAAEPRSRVARRSRRSYSARRGVGWNAVDRSRNRGLLVATHLSAADRKVRRGRRDVDDRHRRTSLSQDATVQLDQLSVVLRQRNPFEAIDLGFAMAREWWRDIYIAWLAVFVPVAVAAWLLLPPLWAALVVWWLKPAFDRVILHVVASEVFGSRPRLRTTLLSYFSYAWNGLLLSLIPLPFLRLALTRSFDLPIRQLENARGAIVRQRGRQLRSRVWTQAACSRSSACCSKSSSSSRSWVCTTARARDDSGHVRRFHAVRRTRPTARAIGC